MRSITNRLALLFFAITLVVIGGLYLGVISGLDRGVREKKLDTLSVLARQYTGPVRDALNRSLDRRVLDARVRHAADASGARVTLLGVNEGTQGQQVYPASDSTAERDISDLQFAVAADAARTGTPRRGTEAGNVGRVAEVAVPLRLTGTHSRAIPYVIVFSAPVEDVDATVSLIRRRVLVAGIVALLVALLAGYFVAQALTRRVRRMERSARRVARGDFSARFETGSRDELGQLAHTLNEMQRQLAALEDARRRFIATASHELRTPIFSLGGFLELIEDEDLDDETRRQFVRQLREQTDRLGRLTTDLLDLSRLGAGSLELRRERVDLGDVARSVAAEFTPALSTHGSRVALELSHEPVEAVCDPGRVAQIMRILIDNSLRHTPAGTDLRITSARENGVTRVAVTDFGAGIKRPVLERIFEPFYTADDARGAGLGLTIAHELAERMHGDLRAESVPGRTTFVLELPA
ncbi:MAG: ATP-binding protein [Solirubrobacteraceae bacterium]